MVHFSPSIWENLNDYERLTIENLDKKIEYNKRHYDDSHVGIRRMVSLKDTYNKIVTAFSKEFNINNLEFYEKKNSTRLIITMEVEEESVIQLVFTIAKELKWSRVENISTLLRNNNKGSKVWTNEAKTYKRCGLIDKVYKQYFNFIKGFPGYQQSKTSIVRLYLENANYSDFDYYLKAIEYSHGLFNYERSSGSYKIFYNSFRCMLRENYNE